MKEYTVHYTYCTFYREYFLTIKAKLFLQHQSIPIADTVYHTEQVISPIDFLQRQMSIIKRYHLNPSPNPTFHPHDCTRTSSNPLDRNHPISHHKLPRLHIPLDQFLTLWDSNAQTIDGCCVYYVYYWCVFFVRGGST